MRTPRRGRDRLLRAAGWLAVLALLELATRALVYALAPSPSALLTRLDGQLGGPRPVVVCLVSLGLATALSAGLVWLAALGARERWALAPAHTTPAPRLAFGRLAMRAGGLWLASMFAFAAIENYIHWRAGLGVHGVACLVGPVHRNAIPVTASLSLIAAAAVTAAGHLLAWMRRTLGRVFGVRPRRPHSAAAIVACELRRGMARVLLASLGPRAPPVAL